MYLMAAVRVGDVLCVRYKVGELLLRLFLRGTGDISEILRHIGRQRTGRDHRRDLWPPGPDPQTIRSGAFSVLARRRAFGQSCHLRRSFLGLDTEPRLPGRRLQSAFAVSTTVQA